MQTLYALESMDEQQLKPGTDWQLLQQHLEQTNHIFTYLLYFMAQVAQYAETDARQKASKHLPTANDLRISTKIAANEYLLQLLTDKGFRLKAEEEKLALLTDKELIKKVYNNLACASIYQQYIASGERDKAGEKHIMEYIFSDLMMKEEFFDQHMEDNFIHWQDDKEMMNVLINNYFNKPQLFNFLQLTSQEKTEYAHDLLRTVKDKKEYCQELIKPKLQNWDPERIAAIDMLLMEMGICELLYFPTIPAKVTINEYIDVAKAYSTPQSGQFVNGILDNVLKELEAGGKINKIERGKK